MFGSEGKLYAFFRQRLDMGKYKLNFDASLSSSLATNFGLDLGGVLGATMAYPFDALSPVIVEALCFCWGLCMAKDVCYRFFRRIA